MNVCITKRPIRQDIPRKWGPPVVSRFQIDSNKGVPIEDIEDMVATIEKQSVPQAVAERFAASMVDGRCVSDVDSWPQIHGGTAGREEGLQIDR